ncbi:hypothetical protein HPB50_006048 [Hyalomma asiaticum]|uniref:Uncharacterized protein n=1 Tax=Hyalomma asiaticum TaxID=266040 RepID=A0ACB7RS36_HYAAI|nr:hypothetical protein HPB50_006048 [Hyalomma asiaticum]
MSWTKSLTNIPKSLDIGKVEAYRTSKSAGNRNELRSHKFVAESYVQYTCRHNEASARHRLDLHGVQATSTVKMPKKTHPAFSLVPDDFDMVSEDRCYQWTSASSYILAEDATSKKALVTEELRILMFVSGVSGKVNTKELPAEFQGIGKLHKEHRDSAANRSERASSRRPIF